MEQRLEVRVDGPADLQLVDALARLQLAARRAGATLTVQASGDLAGLLVLVGLDRGVDQP